MENKKWINMEEDVFTQCGAKTCGFHEEVWRSGETENWQCSGDRWTCMVKDIFPNSKRLDQLLRNNLLGLRRAVRRDDYIKFLEKYVFIPGRAKLSIHLEICYYNTILRQHAPHLTACFSAVERYVVLTCRPTPSNHRALVPLDSTRIEKIHQQGWDDLALPKLNKWEWVQLKEDMEKRKNRRVREMGEQDDLCLACKEIEEVLRKKDKGTLLLEERRFSCTGWAPFDRLRWQLTDKQEVGREICHNLEDLENYSKKLVDKSSCAEKAILHMLKEADFLIRRGTASSLALMTNREKLLLAHFVHTFIDYMVKQQPHLDSITSTTEQMQIDEEGDSPVEEVLI